MTFHNQSPFRRWRRALALILAFTVSACSIVGSDEEADPVDRTLPEALEVREVAFEDIRRTVTAPDTVNIVGFVTNLVICPENVVCILPNGIEVAKESDPDRQSEAEFFAVSNPRQFTQGDRYLLSLRVLSRQGRNTDENRLNLIGYTRLD